MAINCAPQDELRVQAGRIAGNANLRDIRLTQSDVRLHFVPNPTASLSVELDISPEAEIAPAIGDSAGLLLVSCGFSVTISSDAEDVTDSVATLQNEFTAAFTHTLFDEASDEELEAFANTTGLFALYPYAREYISDCTRRLGLPTLVLDLFKP